jgi:hypothetical protein
LYNSRSFDWIQKSWDWIQEPILCTIAIYNASVANFYNATGSLARFENKKKNILFYIEPSSSLLQRWRCSCKFESRRIGSRFCLQDIERPPDCPATGSNLPDREIEFLRLINKTDSSSAVVSVTRRWVKKIAKCSSKNRPKFSSKKSPNFRQKNRPKWSLTK